MKDYNKKLIKRITKIVNEYSVEATRRIKAEWSRYTDEGLGNADISFISDFDLRGLVKSVFIAEGQKAWVLEYGRGSLMEKNSANNPWLEEYTNDPNFNKWRKAHAFAITGREAGEYYDLDGNKHHSTGSLKGVNLEEWHSTKEYYPISPRRIIQSVLYGDGDNGILSEFREAIAECVFESYAEMFDDFSGKEVAIKL